MCVICISFCGCTVVRACLVSLFAHRCLVQHAVRVLSVCCACDSDARNQTMPLPARSLWSPLDRFLTHRVCCYSVPRSPLLPRIVEHILFMLGIALTPLGGLFALDCSFASCLFCPFSFRACAFLAFALCFSEPHALSQMWLVSMHNPRGDGQSLACHPSTTAQ